MDKNLKIFRLIIRALSILILLFGLPFYVGYGNPLPFINPDYTMWDNLWLTIFPIMFTGLFVGLRYHKIGGYIVAVPIAFSLILGFLINGSIITLMFIPLLVGIMNIVLGYMNEDNLNTGS